MTFDLQANCIDSTAEPAKVFAGEIKKLQSEKLKPQEQITLEPYERDHAVVVGVYRWVWHGHMTLPRTIVIPIFVSQQTNQEEGTMTALGTPWGLMHT